MRVTRLLRVALNVSDLAAATRFYAGPLGFAPEGPEAPTAPPLPPGRSRILRRGGQCLELTAFDQPGLSYPLGTRANDLWFQHIAVVTDRMLELAVGYDNRSAFSRDGPVTLPGGVAAWKFRDPDGHPLELIRFPQPDPATAGGIDHSAISVADADRSVAFYAGLGLSVSARQVNAGPAQDRLDGLHGVTADVIALSPPTPAPHVELLCYRAPRGRPAPAQAVEDIAATRLVFASDAAEPTLLTDPDGHRLLCLPEPA